MGKIWVPGGSTANPIPSGKPPPWIAFNQLEWIKEAILAAGPTATFMEWGAGGSSIWFTENLPETVTRVVIESDHDWARKIEEYGVPVTTPTKDSWKRNSHNTDCSCWDPDYIIRPEASFADVILVDGFNRSHCLSYISHMARNDTVVFLHDVNFVQFRWVYFLPAWKGRETMDSDGSNNPSPMGKMVVQR